jgi:hypothetical protein
MVKYKRYNNITYVLTYNIIVRYCKLSGSGPVHSLPGPKPAKWGPV